MSARDQFRIVAKEVRALAPAWAACVVAMLGWKAPGGQYQGLLQAVALIAYLVGAPAVGALSFGQEDNYGTWSFLLTQPISRARVLLTKFGVLVALLVPLGLLATWLDIVSKSKDFGTKVLWMPILLGAFVAPWLTLVIHRAIGAAVFAIAIPGTLFLAGQFVGVRIYGYVRDADTVASTFVGVGVSAACVAGAIFGWRRFMRLELADGGASARPGPHASGVTGRTAVARTHPLWALLVKELRLQQLTLSIAAVYVVAYVISVMTVGDQPSYAQIAGGLTLIYGGLLSMVAGAVASAEERQLGTLDSQLLLPVSLGWQWAVKALTVVAIAVALGYLMPRALVSILPPAGLSSGASSGALVQPVFAVLTLLMAGISLYVSSNCRTTLAAVMIAFPVYTLVAAVFTFLVDPVRGAAYRWVHADDVRYVSLGDPLGNGLLLIVAGVLVTLVARMALSNHRYVDRSLGRIVAHAALFVAALTAGLAALGAFGIR